MRKPNPHILSLNFNPLFNEYPYKDWIKYCTTEKELNDLIEIFQSLPLFWIKSIEERVKNLNKRNYKIDNPLKYRLSLLWNSILIIQETKYICDNVENSMRQVFVNYIVTNKISYKELSEFVPNFEKILKKFELQERKKININSIALPKFIISFSMYELTESIARKWVKFDNKRIGFGIYFKKDKRCRDYNVFRNDMKIIREVRNGIAHSNRLFTQDKIQKIYDISYKWLKPLDIDLSKKINDYRKHRPKFLDNISIRNIKKTIANNLYKQ